MTKSKYRAFKCRNGVHRFHRVFSRAPWIKFCIDCKTEINEIIWEHEQLVKKVKNAKKVIVIDSLTSAAELLMSRIKSGTPSK